MPYPAKSEMTMQVPRYIANGLNPHANRRKITVHELIRRMLAQAVRDNIVDAILDDQEPAPQREAAQ